MQARSVRWRSAIAAVAVACTAVIVLAGCTGGGKQPATGSSAAAGPSTAAGASSAGKPFGQVGAVRAGTHVGASSSGKLFHVVPASDRKQQADLMRTRCESPIANVTCVFAPSGALQPVLGEYQALAPPYPVCATSGFESVNRSNTSEVSNSLGVSVSVELGNVVKQAFEASYSVTWTFSQTIKLDDELEVPSYSLGYIYRAAPMLRSTGDMIIRETGATGLGDTGVDTYQLLGVSFDMPDTSPTAGGKIALATREMTTEEKAAECTPQAIARRKDRKAGAQ